MGHTLYTHTHIHKSTTVFCTLRPAASPCAFSQDFCRRRNIIIVEEFIGAKFTNNFFLQLYSTALHQTTTKLVLLLTRIGNSQKAEEPAKKMTLLLGCKKSLHNVMPGISLQEEEKKNFSGKWWWRQILHTFLNYFFPLLLYPTHKKPAASMPHCQEHSCKQKQKVPIYNTRIIDSS